MGGGDRGDRPYYRDGKRIPNPYEISKQEKLPEEILEGTAKDARIRDTEVHMEHRNAAEEAINADIDGDVSIQYGGSVSRATYVNGVSDVDCRVSINGTSLEGKSPGEIKQYIEAQIRKHDPQVKSTSIGNLAVTARYRDGTEMQFIPVIQMKHGYKVPKGNGWSDIVRENKFTSDFRSTNQKCGGKLPALVRVLKRQNSNMPKSERLSGYNIEALVNKIFKSYPASAPRKLSNMADYYYQKAEKAVMHRTRDKTGQSTFIDKQKLGGPNSNVRQRIASRMRSTRSALNRARLFRDSQALKESVKGEGA